MDEPNNKAALRQKILTIVSIVLCVILIPILIINCTLIIKGLVNPEKVPSFAGITPLIVLTESMEEDFSGGSLIFTKAASAEEIKEGDIISYFDPKLSGDEVTTHKVRFITKDQNGELVFWTYGTSNTLKAFEDVTIDDCEEIHSKYFIGRYTGTHIAGLGSFAMFMQSTWGLIICIGVPIAALVAYDIIRRRQGEKQAAEDKDELMRELEELRRLKSEQNSNGEGKN